MIYKWIQLFKGLAFFLVLLNKDQDKNDKLVIFSPHNVIKFNDKDDVIVEKGVEIGRGHSERSRAKITLPRKLLLNR